MTTFKSITLVLTEDERQYLAMHARYEAQRQEDMRYWHPDTAERARLLARWHEIANMLHLHPWGEKTDAGTPHASLP